MTGTDLGAEALELHRQLVAIPSLSHDETAIAHHVQGYLSQRGASVERLGNNIIARAGSGPRVLLNSHLDTVPFNARWTRDPYHVEVIDGRVYGLGSNDAKASAAAMTAAFLGVLADDGPCEVVLMLVPEEETGGEGTEVAWPHLRGQDWVPAGVVVGEPTGLDIAVAQKGLVVLELETEGDGGHSANAAAQGARNAVYELARDLLALESLHLGDPHPFLGPPTLQPTQTSGGDARNMVPVRARSILDVRTVPGVAHGALIDRVRAAVSGEIQVISERLVPRECDEDAAIVRAARKARPKARCYGSPTLSDLVFFSDVPAIKCGPGMSERSHQPDEFVLESEIRDGVEFYGELIRAMARIPEVTK